MPKKKNVRESQLPAAVVTDQQITDTLRQNYMPYAMTVIISRAIPEIDGFKPAHRKLLYTMYKMGLLTGAKTKSANVVGQTMRLNPHGDASIYETLVRLTRGNEALLYPFIDSKGSFGKQFSDMAYAASRYTEVKLDPFCEEIFRGIDKDAVDFIDNYDSTMKEPRLLPTAFPNILVSPNVGIAVGMASNICSFPLGEVCDAVCALIKDPSTDLLDVLVAPDFSTGGLLLYDRNQMAEIYRTGRGSFKVRARYRYDPKDNCIEISQIPYTTKVEAIIDKIAALVKDGRLKEISDVRDETGLDGLRLTIDLKRGVDSEKLMAKLFRMTPLEDAFPCNFNVLIEGTPRTLGVKALLEEWLYWRIGCVKRELYFSLGKIREKLHLLYGLRKLLLDIDKAVRIIRGTENEKDVVPNLRKGFSIDEVQADYIAEIKLRNLNKEYVIKRTEEIGQLEQEAQETEATLKSDARIKEKIAQQLTAIKKKYAKPRKTQLVAPPDDQGPEETEVDTTPVQLVYTQDGYFKKILPPKSPLAKPEEHKLKENDRIAAVYDGTNADDLLFFTDKGQVYKAKAEDFDPVKPSALGDYIPAKLQFDEGENLAMMCPTRDYSGFAALFFENGKAIKIPLSAYMTKTNRKKLTAAYHTDVPPAGIHYLRQDEEKEFLLLSSGGKAILIKSSQMTQKATRTASGVCVFSLKKGQKLMRAVPFVPQSAEQAKQYAKYRKAKLPSAGTVYDQNLTVGEQIAF